MFCNRLNGKCQFIIIALLVFTTSLSAEETPVYFLVAQFLSHSNYDCYVVPLTKPNDIAYARFHTDLYFPVPKIVVTNYDYWDGKGININRNYLQPGAPSWSWYATEFITFADFTAEILDGWPTGVELGFGGPMLGFWSYWIVAEMGVYNPWYPTELNPWCYILEPDCVKNSIDLHLLTLHWLESDCEYPGWCGGADLNVSGKVDFVDLAILSEKWMWNN